MNANFSSLVSCGNAIDNTNIGSSGIYASQIKPTTGLQATFGGSIGYTFNPNAAAQVPLTISNAGSPSADYFDITNSGATKQFYVDSSGNTNVLNTLNLTATGVNNVTSNTTGSVSAFVLNNNNATPTTGDLLDVQKGGTNKVQVSNAGAVTAQSYVAAGGTGACATAGDVCASRNSTQGVLILGGASSSAACDFNITNSGSVTCNMPLFGTQLLAHQSGTSQNSYVPPIYTSSGLAVASTLHGVIGTCVFSSSTTCNVTLSGAAVFASSTSYSCSVSNTGSSVLFVAQSLATTSFQLSTQASTTTTATYACFGT